jgi:DNA invertase Pin-like site-specific DNA recombinase
MTQPIGYSYVRFSSKGRQAKGSSVQRQTQDTAAGIGPETWCSHNGVTLSNVTYRDLGLTGWDPKKNNATHGELRMFLEACESGDVRPGSYLIVEKIDRISRQGVEEGMVLIRQIFKHCVSIVSLMSGRVYRPDCLKTLMGGRLEIEIELEQAKQYSDNLSKRVTAAWQFMRDDERQGVLRHSRLPPWLKVVGEGKKGRRAVVDEAKAAIVRRIFDLIIGGMGIKRVVATLIAEGVPPITGRSWSRTGIRRILTSRAVLGERQPMRGRGKNAVPDGDPIIQPGLAIVSLETFHRAAACLGSRKTGNTGRDSKLLNVFSGLLKDARSGKSYVTDLRIEVGRNGNPETRHHVLMSAAKATGTYSFPFVVFERAVLGYLQEVNPDDLLPANGHKDEVRGLLAEVDLLKGEVEAMVARLDAKWDDTLWGLLERKKGRLRETEGRLVEAQMRAADPVERSWGEAKSLLGLIDSDPEAKKRLRPVLRRLVESIYLLVIPRGMTRICVVQLHYKGGEARTYLIVHQPAKANGKARQDAVTFTLASPKLPGIDPRADIRPSTGPGDAVRQSPAVGSFERGYSQLPAHALRSAGSLKAYMDALCRAWEEMKRLEESS